MPGINEAESKELRIVGFLCNWCSYGGADTAGVARATQPTDLRIIRVPCSGRVDPLFIVKALLNGADGVLVSGCHPRDCHYGSGNFYARRRLEVLKRFLPILGIDGARFSYTWVSASEGQRWQQVVTKFTEEIHALGKAPRFLDAEVLEKVCATALTPLHPLGTGETIPLDALKDAIKAKLGELDCVIGWQEGRDKAHTVPLFMRTSEDVDKLVVGPFCVNSLATYLTDYADKKVGIVVKGCDGRSVVELLQENLIARDNLVIFALPCEGTLDMARIDQALGRYQTITAVRLSDGTVTIEADGKTHTFPVREYAQSKCYGCTNPLAPLSDMHFGEAAKVEEGTSFGPELAMLEAMTLAERRSFWRTAMERCIRCYACRNSCPLCVCRDHCISDARDPHWTSQEDTSKEKFFFQIIHSLHLAGRCTGCGECQRSCPVGIPILALRQKLNAIMAELFPDYKAGLDPNAVPPLLGYEVTESHITEREWA